MLHLSSNRIRSMSVTWFCNSERVNDLPRFTQLMCVGAGLGLRPAETRTTADICPVLVLLLTGWSSVHSFTRLILPLSLWHPCCCYLRFIERRFREVKKSLLRGSVASDFCNIGVRPKPSDPSGYPSPPGSTAFVLRVLLKPPLSTPPAC